eukprot:gb/GECG01014583.1/.p1 GENE.gb/GECG01014583.1/~~gb/GECG01014583.1/.p1  ORF type:complete len:298 (+),score=43.83 gb/GECG01014583.1/:1-894(+)
MIPGLSTSKPAKPAVKRKTFGTNRLAPGAILPSKKELITGEKPSNADQSTTSSDGESNSASNGTSGVASGKKHGLENGVKGKAKKQKTVDYEEEQLETPDKGRFTFAVVCACNMNRSMAAHKAMQEQGYKVQSFGTARQVKLPGESHSATFPFGTKYTEILEYVKDPSRREWSEEKGVTDMLERNVQLKGSPERWQEVDDPHQFDIIICFESRVFEHLNEDLRSREPSGEPKSLHVINIETKDDTKSADQGAKYALQFAEMAAKLPTNTTLDEGMDHLLPKIQKEIGADPLYVEHRL